MSVGWGTWLDGQRAEETPTEKASRLARQAADREDRETVQAEASRAAALEDERDRRVMAYQQLGIGGRSLGDMAADASRAADEDDAYAEALKTIQRIDKRRAQRAETQRAEAEQLASVQRATSDDPFAAAQRRAHQAFAARTRSLRADAAAGTPRRERRPFPGGDARRSEPVTCAMCLKYGATPEQSFLIHQDPAPEPVPAVPSEDERDWLSSRESAERRTPGRRYAEISR